MVDQANGRQSSGRTWIDSTVWRTVAKRTPTERSPFLETAFSALYEDKMEMNDFRFHCRNLRMPAKLLKKKDLPKLIEIVGYLLQHALQHADG